MARGCGIRDSAIRGFWLPVGMDALPLGVPACVRMGVAPGILDGMATASARSGSSAAVCDAASTCFAGTDDSAGLGIAPGSVRNLANVSQQVKQNGFAETPGAQLGRLEHPTVIVNRAPLPGRAVRSG
jgi:hypothetical protein